MDSKHDVKSDQKAPEAAADVADSEPIDSGQDTQVADGACKPSSTIPAEVPADWEEFTDWSCQCRMFMPGAKGTKPPPASWEPCKAPGPQNVACQQMKTDWRTNLNLGSAMAFYPKYGIDPKSGKALLAFTRVYVGNRADRRMEVVAEADGEVRFAILQTAPDSEGCTTSLQRMQDGKVAYQVYGDAASGELDTSVEGVIAGGVDERPRVMFKYTDGAKNLLRFNWAVSSEWLMQSTRGKGVELHSWDLTKHTGIIYGPGTDPESLLPYEEFAITKDAFWNVNGGDRSGIMSWDPVNGTRPLLRWIGDWSRGAGNLGTDGKDTVWSYGENRPLGSEFFQKISVMTAPYTTDPAEAQSKARRLTTDLADQLGLMSFGVGCGYAVHAVKENGLQVVRLADGYSWSFPGFNDPSNRWAWVAGLGANCEYIYMSVMPWQNFTIARIRIDSLGSGTPPQ